MSESEEVFESDTDNMPTKVSVRVKPRSKRPKVVSDWSDDEIFKLIGCVEERPGLWDVRDTQYRNKHERTKLWDDMSENDFGSKFEGTELLAKWTNLRIQHRSYENKKLKSDQAAPPLINWKYYSALKFIRQTETEQTASTESNLIDEESEIGNIPRSASKRKRSSVSVAKISPPATTIVAESRKAAVESTNQWKPQPRHSDEFDTFGNFLASELRSLDDIAMARRIKLKLNRYFLDVVEEEQQLQLQMQVQNEQIIVKYEDIN